MLKQTESGAKSGPNLHVALPLNRALIGLTSHRTCIQIGYREQLKTIRLDVREKITETTVHVSSNDAWMDWFAPPTEYIRQFRRRNENTAGLVRYVRECQNNLRQVDSGQFGQGFRDKWGFSLETAIDYGVGFSREQVVVDGSYFPAGLIFPTEYQKRGVGRTIFWIGSANKAGEIALSHARIGSPMIYGGNMLRVKDRTNQTLVICNNEINCLAVVDRVRKHGLPVDVVSYFGDSPMGNEGVALSSLSGKYKELVVLGRDMKAFGSIFDRVLWFSGGDILLKNGLIIPGIIDSFIVKLLNISTQIEEPVEQQEFGQLQFAF